MKNALGYVFILMVAFGVPSGLLYSATGSGNVGALIAAALGGSAILVICIGLADPDSTPNPEK